MNQDEFAFFNQQLAAMLKEGIPLEGAVKQLCAGMRRSRLRAELEKVEADLVNGVPLLDAMRQRTLPDLYVRMVQAGARSNDLPGILLLLADHYHRGHSISTRLKGLMVYPVIVLVASFALSALLAITYIPFLRSAVPLEELWFTRSAGTAAGHPFPEELWIALPACLLGGLVLTLALFVMVPALRRWMLWRLPAFKEANLARFASCMELMLKAGNTLEDALSMARTLEARSPLGRELPVWERRLANGGRHLRDIGADSRAVPPLFVWLVDSCGADMPEGFAQAARLFASRAAARSEMMLYAALPISILTLAVLIVSQVLPLVRMLARNMGSLF